MQGYWKKDVTGAMILPEGGGRERGRERGAPRPFLRARCAFLSTTNRRVSVLPLSAPSLVPCSCHRGTRPLPPSARSFRPIPLLFRSPSFTLPRRSRRRYGRFDAERRDVTRTMISGRILFFLPAGRSILRRARGMYSKFRSLRFRPRSDLDERFERAVADRSAAPRRDPVSRRDRDSGIRDESLGTAWSARGRERGWRGGGSASLHLRRYIS